MNSSRKLCPCNSFSLPKAKPAMSPRRTCCFLLCLTGLKSFTLRSPCAISKQAFRTKFQKYFFFRICISIGSLYVKLLFPWKNPQTLLNIHSNDQNIAQLYRKQFCNKCSWGLYLIYFADSLKYFTPKCIISFHGDNNSL